MLRLKTYRKYYNHGSREANILHCQLRNKASNLKCTKHCVQIAFVQKFDTLQLLMHLSLQLILNDDNNLTYNPNVAILKLKYIIL